MGSDVVVVGSSQSEGFVSEKFDDGTWMNEYYIHLKQGDIYVEIVDNPLANALTHEDIDEYEWMNQHDSSRFVDVEAQVKKYKDEYVVIGDID